MGFTDTCILFFYYFSRKIAYVFREKLNELRKSKNWSQEKVAFDLDVSQSTYSDWENDISIPKKENLIRLSEIFEVDVNELSNEIYNIHIENKKNGIAVVNSPNSKINATEAILKVSESLDNLVKTFEKFLQQSNSSEK